MQLIKLSIAPSWRPVIACAAALVGVMCAAGAANAVPVLQVGAPGGPGEGTYADYQPSTTNPTETDTAITSGGTLYVGGIYQKDDVEKLGGQSGSGNNWSSFGLPALFDTHDAVLLVSVPDGSLADALASLTVNGLLAFYSSEDQSFFPNNHDPVKDAISDFLFFDIGDFAESVLVPNFADESAGDKLGEIKTLLIAGFGDLPWAHFDVMALETTVKGTKITTTLENNPGSKDVTWKPGDGPGPDPEIDVPEPATLTLLGAGLVGLGLLARRRKPAA